MCFTTDCVCDVCSRNSIVKNAKCIRDGASDRSRSLQITLGNWNNQVDRCRTGVTDPTLFGSPRSVAFDGRRLGMVYEARGEKKAAADCYRKVIEFVRTHPDQYEPTFTVTFAQMVDELDPSRAA